MPVQEGDVMCFFGRVFLGGRGGRDGMGATPTPTLLHTRPGAERFHAAGYAAVRPGSQNGRFL